MLPAQELIVDAATLADYDAIRALDKLLVGVRDRAEALRAWIAAGECLVARAGDGAIAGFAIANCSFFEQSFIWLLVVHPAQRRRGVASALIGAVEARSPTRALFTSTNQSNTAMHAVCAALGFVRSGSLDNLNEPGDPEIFYFKQLR